jgi:hypothetical protein
MESARARKTKLMQGQKEEDEAVRNMPDWVPPLRTSRPSSVEMDQSEKVDSKMTKMVIKKISISACCGTGGESGFPNIFTT